VGAGAEAHVVAAKRGQLRDPQSGLDRGQQERMVASPGQGVAVRSGEEGTNFFCSEERHECAVKALGGDREDALNDLGMLGVPERGIAKQRADRSQADVARPHRVLALALEVIEKRADEMRVEI
jgi:hypothetical protein